MSGRLPGPSGWSQVSYMRALLRDPTPVLDELSARYGGVFGFGAGPMRVAVVGEPAALRALFATSTDSFRWAHKFNVLGFVVGNQSLIVSDGADHKRRRASVQQAFSRRRLNAWIPTIVEHADGAIDAMLRDADGEQAVDLAPVFRMLVLGIVVRALFGERLATRTPEIAGLFERPQKYLESPALQQMPHPFPHTARARVRADRRALDAIIDAEIAERRSHPSEHSTDVLDALVQEQALSDAEIRDQAITLIGAGYDTTSASLAWMLWCAVLAPGVWEALRAEADTVLVGEPDTSTLARLTYANAVMRETLRLHPAGTISPREAAVDVVLDGHRIRKGTLILWSPYLAGRNAEMWPDPLRFDPDRFGGASDAQRALNDQAWVPFGRGARNCLGFALAQMELTLCMARIAQRLDVSVGEQQMPRPVGMVVNRPEGGVPVRLHRRR